MSRLAILAFQIPILEAKLKSMKRERKRLGAGEAMKARWADPTYRKRVIAAVKTANQRPERLAHLRSVHFSAHNRLPWPTGTPKRNAYRGLTRKGWSRQEAISKVEAIHAND